jgi:hypothetical protein
MNNLRNTADQKIHPNKTFAAIVVAKGKATADKPNRISKTPRAINSYRLWEATALAVFMSAAGFDITP